MLTFTNDDIRQKIKSEEPGNTVVAEAVDKIDFLPFPHLEESVKDDINFLKASKLLKAGTHLSGWIYDVTTGKVCDLLLILPKKAINDSPDHPCNRSRNLVIAITCIYILRNVYNV